MTEPVGEHVYDMFPFGLVAPIVLVERLWPDESDDEEHIEEDVEKFEGVFAGT
jgi:hypothetical protein